MAGERIVVIYLSLQQLRAVNAYKEIQTPAFRLHKVPNLKRSSIQDELSNTVSQRGMKYKLKNWNRTPNIYYNTSRSP